MNGSETGTTAGRSRTRREALGAVGAAGALVLAGCTGGDSGSDDGGNGDGGGTTSPDSGGAVRIGLSVAQSGSRNNEGEQMLAGYRVAAKQINEGTGGVTVEPFAEVGAEAGLLGRDVELVVEDSQSTAEGAQRSAEALVETEGVVMFTGGTSAAEGVSHQAVAADAETVYTGGFTPTGTVSGENCTRYAFNEMYNARMAADSLAPIVGREMGVDSEVNFAQLYPGNDFGEEFSAEIRDRFASIGDGWFHQVRESTREGERSYGMAIQDVLNTQPDLVILNYYGLDAANALRDFEEVADPDVGVVVPMFNRQFARTAGGALEGVIGTVHWPPEPPDEDGRAVNVSHPFRDTFLANWSDPAGGLDVPSPVSHLAYVQLCQYAAAVERAGTFDADPVIDELGGHTYAYGMGDQTLRTCDHQAMRTVPVVVGLPGAEHEPGNFYRLSELQTSLGLGGSEPYTCNQSPAAFCGIE